MAYVFQKAVKAKSKARVGLIGPSGSGKTYTALLLATHMGNRIALIDTEHGSASKYADEFDFDTLWLDNYHPKNYIEAIKAAGEAGYDVLIIDSLSHAWAGTDGALELADKNAAKYGGNRYAAWRDVTPLHNQLIEAILSSPCHVIATMRSKMEYVQTIDEKGRTVIRKVGMAPIQRDGMEYEFDVVGDLDIDHTLVISKTRCKALDGAIIKCPGKELADTLKAWLSDGVEMPQAQKPVEKPHPARDEKPAEKPPTQQGNGRNKPDWTRFWTQVRPLGLSKEFINREASAFFNCSIQKSLTEIPDLDNDLLQQFAEYLVETQQRGA